MTITRLTSYNADTVAALDKLMQELSPTSFCNEEKLARVLSDGNSHVYVAKEDSSIVGTATLCISHTPEFTIGTIEAVVVLPEYRRKKIAWMLIETLIKDAKEAGIEELHLTSNPMRIDANRLYQKMGFEQKKTNVYEMKFV